MGSTVKQLESFEYDDKYLLNEMNFAKFRNFAKENFQNNVRFNGQRLDFLKWIPQHFAFNLPPKIDEYFISINDAPYFWVSNTPKLAALENVIKSTNGAEVSSNIHEIKKLYSKWITQKDAKEREYYARYTINLIEHNTSKDNFFLNLLYATLVSYDSQMFLPDKAISLLDESQLILDNIAIDGELKKFVMYLINLFSGFVYLKMGDVQLADLKFTDAQLFKENGLTAIYYNALTQKRLQANDNALDLISKIIEFDKRRFNYAFEINNVNMYSYFLHTAFIYKIFPQQDFADMLFDIQTFLLTDKKEFDVVCGTLIDSLDNLMVLSEDITFDADVENEIDFLKTFIFKFRSSVNRLIPFSKNLLIQKFNSLIDLILEKIKNQRTTYAETNLFLYSKQIEKGARSKELLAEAAEKRKVEIKAHLEFEIKSIEEAHKAKAALIEGLIENLGDENKFDPSQAFSSSMIINIVISLIIFIIGGFADGFIGSGSSGNETFFSTMVGGIKWGGITFLLGTIVSFFSSISAIWERATKKQNLIKEISLRKNMKERTVKAIKQEFSNKMEEFEDHLRRKIKSIDADIESLTKDRGMKAEQYAIENEAIIEKYKDRLRKIKIG